MRTTGRSFLDGGDHLHKEQRPTVPGVVAQADRAVSTVARIEGTAACTRPFHGALLDLPGWEEPPVRSNKEVLRSKLFVGAHVGADIVMIVACRNKRSRDEWHSEVPAVAALFGMDYLQFRFIGGANAIGAPIYEMIHYGRASTRRIPLRAFVIPRD